MIARRIERAAGMPPGWLDTDHESEILTGRGAGVAVSTSPPTPFDQASGRGAGPTLRPLAYLAEWIAQSLPDAAVRSVQVLAGAHAAMPTNTIALVDCSIQRLLDDGAYVLEFSGLRVVRRATRQIDGSWQLTAESGGGEPSRVAQTDEAKLHVIGRIIGTVKLERM
jgi:hypothetical protein